jgi:hypothetical protein
MKTSDILLLSNCTNSPNRRIFVGQDKAIAIISSIIVATIIATALVAAAVAGFKQGEVVINRAAEGVVAVERQMTRGGPLMGYNELW